MSIVYTINNIDIPESVVLESPKTKESITLGSVDRQLLPSELDLKLDNIDGTYDDRVATSIFFGTDWYNSELTIYDTEEGVYTWIGRVKSIDLDQTKKEVTVKSKNYIQDIAETLIVYSSTTSTTPAEHIYNILTDVVGLPSISIGQSGFTEAINIQEASSVYCNVVYTAADDKKCLPVITELCRMTQCELYTEDNQVKLKQYQVYNGELGTLVEEKNLIAKNSYKHFFDETNIVNSYNIKYDSAGTIATATGSNTTSQNSFGVRNYNIPNEAVDSTDSSEYKILFKSSGAAIWAGDLAILRFKSLLKYFTINAGSELDTVKLNNQVDLSFDGMSREPGRIVDKDHNTSTGIIKFKGYYINTPFEYYSRDITAPVTPEINQVFSMPDGSLAVKFTQNFETDFAGYKLYFTSSVGEWESEISQQGSSPIDIKNPSTTADGYNYFIISGLNKGTNYSFKMKSYDSSLNLSSFSNIVSATPYIATENQYMLAGDFIQGLTLDQTNPQSGETFSGISVYGTALYGTGTYTYSGIYQTEFFKNSCFSSITFKGYSQQGTLQYQYDQSNDGSIYDGWSTPADATGTTVQSLTKKYFKIRFLFSPIYWTDSDNIYILEVN